MSRAIRTIILLKKTNSPLEIHPKRRKGFIGILVNAFDGASSRADTAALALRLVNDCKIIVKCDRVLGTFLFAYPTAYATVRADLFRHYTLIVI